jgi:ADP-ribose pyrophosphatase YjhB (NUDIX family)
MSGSPRPAPPAGGRPVRRPSPARLARVDETSAGGLVLDRRGDVPRAALIARHDRRGRLVWSLPKGHLERDETLEEAAVREVEEETGIRGRVLGHLGTIDFWFVAEQRRVHKTVHHYLLEAEGGELSDADIEVVEVAWVPLDEVPARLAYADERRLVERVPEVLGEPDAAPGTPA